MTQDNRIIQMLYLICGCTVLMLGLLYIGKPYIEKFNDERSPDPMNRVKCWENGAIVYDTLVKGRVSSSFFKKDIVIYDKSGKTSVFTGDCVATPVDGK